MADVSDVLNAFVTAITTILYPTPPTGEQASPVAGLPVRIEPGWPLPQSLDTAMAAGKAHVSVFPAPGSERNTTRYSEDWQEVSRNAKTYAIATVGQVITVSGAAPSPFFVQNFAVLLDTKAPYLVQTVANQTPAAIAAALQALIAVDYPSTTVIGAVITLPAGVQIKAARLGSTGTSVREIRQQERVIDVHIWAPSPAFRDAIAKAIDAPLNEVRFLPLVDLTKCRVTYRGSRYDDTDQKAGIFRRDFSYLVEYSTTLTEIDTEIVDTKLVITTQTDGAASSAGTPVTTVYG